MRTFCRRCTFQIYLDSTGWYVPEVMTDCLNYEVIETGRSYKCRNSMFMMAPHKPIEKMIYPEEQI